MGCWMGPISDWLKACWLAHILVHSCSTSANGAKTTRVGFDDKVVKWVGSEIFLSDGPQKKKIIWAWNLLLPFRLCMIFWGVGNSLCNTFVRGKNDYDCKEAHEQRGFCLLKQVQGNSGRQFESVLYELHQRDFSSQRQLFFWRNKKSVKWTRPPEWLDLKTTQATRIPLTWTMLWEV